MPGSISLYEISIPVFLKQLGILSKLLQKGVAHAADSSNEVKESTLTEAKLVADMGDLCYQIQRVSDTAKGFAVRVAKVENTPLEDNEKTMAQLEERVQKTIAILEKAKEADVNAAENAEVILKTQKGDLKLTGKSYVIDYALPNFAFHFVTAYALLRKEGVNVGKNDYLGRN